MSANGKTDELTPKQELFLAYYLDPKSKTFSNALQSALRAGYTEQYARSIGSKSSTWMAENVIGRQSAKLLEKAEKVMHQTLEYEPVDENGKRDNQLLAIQNKTSQFVAETVGKDIYSKKTELEVTEKEINPVNAKILAKIEAIEEQLKNDMSL